jgi:multiple sugar transport system permease protein
MRDSSAPSGAGLVVTLGTTLLAIAASTLAGYVYARYRSRFLSSTAFGLLAARMLPPIIITVPLFPVLNALRLNDTHTLLILLYAAFYVSLGTWIMRAFVAKLPVELEEAAAVDGAGLAPSCGASSCRSSCRASSPSRSSSSCSPGTSTCSR